MNTNNYFDITRLKYLLLRQTSIHYKTLLIAAGAIAGFIIFVGTISLIFNNSHSYQPGLYRPFFFIGGYIFSSVIFSELVSSQKGYLFLTLPATTLEKLLSAWLVSSIFYILFSSVVIYVINFYFISVSATFSGGSIEIVNIFTPGVIKSFGVYIVTQSIFFLGAIYFQRINFMKTILSLFILVIIIAIFTSIMTKILFTGTLNNLNWTGNLTNIDHLEYLGKNVVIIAKILFWGCTAPFFLTVSYFCLKEKQV